MQHGDPRGMLSDGRSGVDHEARRVRLFRHLRLHSLPLVVNGNYGKGMN